MQKPTRRADLKIAVPAWKGRKQPPRAAVKALRVFMASIAPPSKQKPKVAMYYSGWDGMSALWSIWFN